MNAVKKSISFNSYRILRQRLRCMHSAIKSRCQKKKKTENATQRRYYDLGLDIFYSMGPRGVEYRPVYGV